MLSVSSKHVAVVKTKPTLRTKPGEIEAWLLKQVAYTMHRRVGKRFPSNPHSINNWECNLVDVQTVRKLNDNCRYINGN